MSGNGPKMSLIGSQVHVDCGTPSQNGLVDIDDMFSDESVMSEKRREQVIAARDWLLDRLKEKRVACAATRPFDKPMEWTITCGTILPHDARRKHEDQFCVVRLSNCRKEFTCWHDSFDKAATEAERLSREIGGRFVVLQQVGIVEAAPKWIDDAKAGDAPKDDRPF